MRAPARRIQEQTSNRRPVRLPAATHGLRVQIPKDREGVTTNDQTLRAPSTQPQASCCELLLRTDDANGNALSIGGTNDDSKFIISSLGTRWGASTFFVRAMVIRFLAQSH